MFLQPGESDNIIVPTIDITSTSIVKGAGAGAAVTASGIFGDIIQWKTLMEEVTVFAPATVANVSCGLMYLVLP